MAQEHTCYTIDVLFLNPVSVKLENCIVQWPILTYALLRSALTLLLQLNTGAFEAPFILDICLDTFIPRGHHQFHVQIVIRRQRNTTFFLHCSSHLVASS